MSTPSWYGSIGVMHARHLRRRRRIGARLMGALFGSLRRAVLGDGRRQQSGSRWAARKRALGAGPCLIATQSEAMRIK
jgi:hypothetical protein